MLTQPSALTEAIISANQHVTAARTQAKLGGTMAISELDAATAKLEVAIQLAARLDGELARIRRMSRELAGHLAGANPVFPGASDDGGAAILIAPVIPFPSKGAPQ